MKANKWVAVLVTGSVLATAVPVSAQFGGLSALKKKLETVAKELEKPKPAPQPQPTAPPQSRPATSQGGYASSAPQPQPTARPTPPQAPAPANVVATPPQANAATIPVVAATEIWYCITESSATTTRLEFSFFKNENGRFFGTFKEYYRYEDEGLKKSRERSGRFSRTNNRYNLLFDDKNRSRFDVYAPESDDQKLLEIRYSHFELSESFNMIEFISPERMASAEEAGGDTDVARCEMSKHMLFEKSFDEYLTSDRFSDNFLMNEEKYKNPPRPNFIGRDKAFISDKDEINHELVNYWDMPIFAEKYLVYQGGSSGEYLLLIDRISGQIIKFADLDYDNIDHFYQKDSNLVITLATKPESEICFLKYAQWIDGRLKYFVESELPLGGNCREQITINTRPGDSYWARAEVDIVKNR